MLRRGYDVTVGKIGDKEIDFVCEKAGEKIYLQVAYLLATEDTIKREFGAFDNVKDNYPKYVITRNDLIQHRSGILHVNIVPFMKENKLF